MGFGFRDAKDGLLTAPDWFRCAFRHVSPLSRREDGLFTLREVLRMLQIKNLTITHRKDLTTLVEGLTFVLAPGDRAALIGEEGNGKSTVLKLLSDPSLVEPYVEWTGEITGGPLRRGYMAQELTPEELSLPVSEFCNGTPAFEMADPGALARTARQLGLDSALFYDWRSMSTLSGGERVKLRLALLLLDQPDILLLDEPSNDLDLETLQWLEDFLCACTVPVLYVSHDVALLERTANLVIHLERLSRRSQPRVTVSRSGYRDYMETRSAAMSHQEKTARKEQAEFASKMERFRRIRDRVDHEQAVITRQDPHGGRMLKKKMHAVQSLGRRFERERENMTAMPQSEEAIFAGFDEQSVLPAGKVVLRLDLPVLSAGERTLAEDIRLWVTGPERVGIVGRNGAGKSTLLKIAAEQLLPRTDIKAAYMPQNYDEGLLRDRTPVDLLAPSGRKEDVTRARTMLGTMKYATEEMDHPAAALSGGQRAKLLLLGMMLQGANVLLLDEPTRNFSPLSAPVIRRALAEFPGCIISVSHDRLYLEQTCTRVLELGPWGLRQLWSA